MRLNRQIASISPAQARAELARIAASTAYRLNNAGCGFVTHADLAQAQAIAGARETVDPCEDCGEPAVTTIGTAHDELRFCAACASGATKPATTDVEIIGHAIDFHLDHGIGLVEAQELAAKENADRNLLRFNLDDATVYMRGATAELGHSDGRCREQLELAKQAIDEAIDNLDAIRRYGRIVRDEDGQ